MASAFGGQRSIQLSYGCLLRVYSDADCGSQRQSQARWIKITLGKKIVAKFQRVDQHIDLVAWCYTSRNDARQVALTPICSINGIAQWVPARTATPFLSSTVEMSCACAAPSSVKEKIAALVADCPLHAEPVQPVQPVARIIAQVRAHGRRYSSMPRPIIYPAPRPARSSARCPACPPRTSSADRYR